MPAACSLYAPAGLSAEQKQKWDRQFDVADTNADGTIDAAEGQAFFLKSGLGTDVLHKIWSMAGACCVCGLPLPPCLLADSARPPPRQR